MKKLRWLLCCSALVISSCGGIHMTGNEKLPPGQAKKINGDQSAKAYAPGQQKNNKKPDGI